MEAAAFSRRFDISRSDRKRDIDISSAIDPACRVNKTGADG